MATKEVLQCRCTCKTLCQLISDPYFGNHFLLRSHFFSLVYRSKLRKIQFSRLVEGKTFAIKTLEHVSMRIIPQKDDLELVGSSKGFLCLWNKSSNANNLYITNPLLGESAILPKPLGDKYAAIDETCWFGYIPPLGIFKVLKVKVRRALMQSNPHKYNNKSEVHVLVIGTDTWKYAGDAPFPRNGKFCKTILNCCLHWMVGDIYSLQLHSFNMLEDQAHSIPSPPKLGNEYSLVEVGVVGSDLGLIGWSSDQKYVQIWLMKEYGVASSWAKYVTVSIPSSVQTVSFARDKELQFIWNFGMLLSFDPKEKKFTGRINMGSKRMGDIWLYTPSFLSLKHLCLGARLRVKNTRSYLT